MNDIDLKKQYELCYTKFLNALVTNLNKYSYIIEFIKIMEPDLLSSPHLDLFIVENKIKIKYKIKEKKLKFLILFLFDTLREYNFERLLIQSQGIEYIKAHCAYLGHSLEITDLNPYRVKKIKIEYKDGKIFEFRSLKMALLYIDNAPY